MGGETFAKRFTFLMEGDIIYVQEVTKFCSF